MYMYVDVDSPWIVLEYLPHGDLKSFLIVSTTEWSYHCKLATIIIDHFCHSVTNRTLYVLDIAIDI